MKPNSKLAARAGAALLGLGLVTAAGCNALLEIGDIEFGDPVGGAFPGGGGYGAQPTGGGGQGNTVNGGGGSGTTTGGNGSGAWGGGGASPCTEICDDGSDNDGNSLADCADPCCQGIGYRCVPTTGFDNPWNGPVVAYIGADAPSGCPSSWTVRNFQGAVGSIDEPAPHTCSGCSCDSPAGMSCSPGTIQFFESAGCGGVSPGAQAQSSGCTAVTPGALPLVSARAASPSVTGGTCAPSGGAPSLPDWSAATEVTVCGAPVAGAGCGADQACVHVPEGYSACITRGGSNPNCSAFTEYTVEETGEEVIDDRICTACSCGTPAGATCSASTTIFSDVGCTASIATAQNDGSSCATVSGPSALTFAAGAVTGGSCTPAGGEPIGYLTTATATLCCLP
jgi:hypothetical protein